MAFPRKSENMNDLISVIIPTFNRSSVLVRAVHSVLNQTYKNFELIIVDDGSTDDTEKILAPFADVRYIKTKNAGVSSARNRGVDLARGKWLAFLDSDDEWLPQKLQAQMDFFSQHPHLSIVYNDEIWVRNNVRVNKKVRHQKAGGWIFAQCLEQCLIAPSSVLLSKELFLEMGGFDENFLVCEDYDLWLKISSKYEVGFINESLIVKYGGHEDQLSTKFHSMDLWRIKSMQKLLCDTTLSLDKKNEVVKVMKSKGSILIKGLIKHGNVELAREIESILSL